jgi:hypothetical protein
VLDGPKQLEIDPISTFLSTLIDRYKKQPEFRVYKSSTPNGNRRWYIIGRPAGKRIRASFATKEQAEAEATERNVKMRKLGETVVTLDHDLLSAATEAATLLKPYGKSLRDAMAHYLAILRFFQPRFPAPNFAPVSIRI